MFGTNPVAKQVLNDGQRFWVQEAFYTLQGEGPFAGEPAVFVRLAGCNLQCFFCDTDFTSSDWYPTIDELMGRIAHLAGDVCDLVVLTGGEPLRQNIVPLVRMCNRLGMQVQIETAGTLWLDGLEELMHAGGLHVVCSPKTGKVHPMVEKYCHHFKYILRMGEVDADDYLPDRSTQVPGTQVKLFRPPPAAQVWVQPMEEYKHFVKLLEAKTKESRLAVVGNDALSSVNKDVAATAENTQLCVEAALKKGYRLSLQTHKIVGLP